jgi:hypothetical protein
MMTMMTMRSIVVVPAEASLSRSRTPSRTAGSAALLAAAVALLLAPTRARAVAVAPSLRPDFPGFAATWSLDPGAARADRLPPVLFEQLATAGEAAAAVP